MGNDPARGRGVRRSSGHRRDVTKSRGSDQRPRDRAVDPVGGVARRRRGREQQRRPDPGAHGVGDPRRRAQRTDRDRRGRVRGRHAHAVARNDHRDEAAASAFTPRRCRQGGVQDGAEAHASVASSAHRAVPRDVHRDGHRAGVAMLRVHARGVVGPAVPQVGGPALPRRRARDGPGRRARDELPPRSETPSGDSPRFEAGQLDVDASDAAQDWRFRSVQDPVRAQQDAAGRGHELHDDGRDRVVPVHGAGGFPARILRPRRGRLRRVHDFLPTLLLPAAVRGVKSGRRREDGVRGGSAPHARARVDAPGAVEDRAEHVEPGRHGAADVCESDRSARAVGDVVSRRGGEKRGRGEVLRRVVDGRGRERAALVTYILRTYYLPKRRWGILAPA
mmetsp:Transcript_15679/g.56279  ORF Transcript_15679/g.56279 Transcript_15679/m.56279 type:complete len:392 (+) Transcript_15679:787-1962(+)